ncbi:MAG TPA: tetrahydrofolate dehydrogenase/cyclohydrolase catalytic domain-containing protein [Actinomycetota bacterium]|nr:tetrahydrofolate dehydrogenase/cyclohydrolase catalytic domain-containing protein [Actinomycetota bacterium]
MATVIDGNALAARLGETVHEELEAARASGAEPGLTAVLVGSDPAAGAYERQIGRLAERLGCPYTCERMDDGAPVDDVLATIRRLNDDPAVTGILVLRPLPSGIEEELLNDALDPDKDVEAVHPKNAGLLVQSRPRFVPSTAAACFHILDEHAQSTERDPSELFQGKTLVVVGRSISVGKPAVALGLQRNATVVTCHSLTAKAGKLADFTRLADILIVAAGRAGLVDGDMVREGVIVIDVGMNGEKDEETGKWRFVGDVDFESVAAKAEAITPVPGGVGPVTDVWLIRNAVTSAVTAARPRVSS